MRRLIFVISTLSLFFNPPPSVARNQKNGSFDMNGGEIQNGLVKVDVKKHNGVYSEKYFAKKGSSWITLLESGNNRRLDPTVKQNGRLLPLAFQKVEVKVSSKDEKTLSLEASSN
ncbi:MAG: hypothetical protein HY089_09830, partial [Ignavibacteriales bacterium]|nr:hypothetical protein [Ignavibacteriales bacterium]